MLCYSDAHRVLLEGFVPEPSMKTQNDDRDRKTYMKHLKMHLAKYIETLETTEGWNARRREGGENEIKKWKKRKVD